MVCPSDDVILDRAVVVVAWFINAWLLMKKWTGGVIRTIRCERKEVGLPERTSECVQLEECTCVVLICSLFVRIYPDE